MSAAPDSSSAVETVGLAKSYLGKPALESLDLEILDGQRVTLIGHNGSGKTTLLRILAGTLEATDGSATVGGHPVGALAARTAVSYLPDQPVFYDDLSVWEHLEFTARLHDTADWEQHAVDLLDAVGLLERADDLPATFSRGLKQKAAVSLAFVRPFEVLLIDEPFVGLDGTGRDALLGLIDTVHRDGATVVVATHELTTVQHGDRVIALASGTVIFDGSPGEADVSSLAEGIAPPPPASPPP